MQLVPITLGPCLSHCVMTQEHSNKEAFSNKR